MQSLRRVSAISIFRSNHRRIFSAQKFFSVVKLNRSTQKSKFTAILVSSVALCVLTCAVGDNESALCDDKQNREAASYVSSCQKSYNAGFARYIDHTVLKQTCRESDIQQVCQEAKDYGFIAICIPAYWIETSKKYLAGSCVKVATVIGFPFGYSVITSKVEEIRQAINAGADEVDIVANISAIKEGQWDYLRKEIDDCMKVVRSKPGIICKVIIESGVLTNDEIIKCCEIYDKAGIDYLKTSTGYAEKGASVETVKLFRSHLSPSIQIKASGGIRTFKDAQSMIDAGATRLGCSASVNIVKGEQQSLQQNQSVSAVSGNKGNDSGGY
jgi:deoxyribose-phosphate aldolase